MTQQGDHEDEADGGEPHEVETMLHELLAPKTDAERRRRVIAMIGENVKLREQARQAEAKPQRLTQGEIIRALLERGSTEHSAVTIARNSRGVVQLEVTCRTGDSGAVQTVEEAEAVAREVFDRLREQYPYNETPEAGS